MGRRVLLLCLLAALCAGCSEAFDPFLPEDAGFALYGVLDARRDTQFVRVEALAGVMAARGGAQFTSTDRASGAMRVWRDSLVTLDDGRLGLVFFYPFAPRPGRTYDLAVTDPVGGTVTSHAAVTVPPEPILTPVQPVNFSGTVSQRLALDSALLPTGVAVTYVVRRSGTEEEAEIVFDYEALPVFQGTGYSLLVSLSRDARAIRSQLGVDPDEEGAVDLLGLRLGFELAAEPVDVEDGVGAVGAVAGFEAGWTLATDFVEALGFVDAQGGASAEASRAR